MKNIYILGEDAGSHLVYDGENTLCGLNITSGAVKQHNNNKAKVSCKNCKKAIKVVLIYCFELNK